MARHRRPAASTARVTSGNPASYRSATATWAPSRASPTATAWPMLSGLAAPATMATRSASGMGSLSLLACAPHLLDAGIERVPDGVADQVEGDHREHERDAREQREPGRLPQHQPPVVDHVAPRRGGLGDAEAEEAEHRLGQDGRRDQQGAEDDDRVDAVDQHVADADA